MYRNLQGIGLLITVLTAFIVVDATAALAQKQPMTVQITITEDAVTELENWPQDGIAFTSARTPLKSLNDLKSPGDWAVSGSEIIPPLARLLMACGITKSPAQALSTVALGEENFPKLFLENGSLRLLVTSTKTKNVFPSSWLPEAGLQPAIL